MPSARNGDRAELTESWGTVRRAVEAFLKVHERQESGQDALLVVVGEPHPTCRHQGKLHGGGFHVGRDFGLPCKAGLPLRGLTAEFGAIVLNAQQEVLDAEQFRFKLLRYRYLAPAQAGGRRHMLGHDDPSGPTESKGSTKVPKGDIVGNRRKIRAYVGDCRVLGVDSDGCVTPFLPDSHQLGADLEGRSGWESGVKRRGHCDAVGAAPASELSVSFREARC